MTTKNVRDTMYAGNRRVLGFTIRDEDAAILDLTGMTGEWKLSRLVGSAPSGDALLTLTSAAGDITFTEPRSSGVLTVIIDEGATSGFLGLFYWELELTDGGGNSNVVAVGDIEIRKNI